MTPGKLTAGLRLNNKGDFMTRFEELMNKSERCLETAKRTTGRMSVIWLAHSTALKEMAMNLSWEEANRRVK